MTFDSAAKTITITPNSVVANTGDYVVTLVVDDQNGRTATYAFNVVITIPNLDDPQVS